MKHRFCAIDLFAGCGGCTVGLKRAGFKVLGAVEIDSRACETFRQNHSDVNLWQKSIENLTSTEILQEVEKDFNELDLLAGCPPCQGFSSVRTLNGKLLIEDEWNDLIFHFQRLVKDLRPKAVMLENVPGLATDARFSAFRSSLRELGYEVESRVLDAAEYGVPQRRRRLIMIAGQDGLIRFPPRAKIRRTVRMAIGDSELPSYENDPVHDTKERRTEEVMRKIQAIPKDGGSRADLPIEMQLKCHRNCDGFKDIYGRMAWDRVAPTLTTGCFNPSRGRFLHPEEDRPNRHRVIRRLRVNDARLQAWRV